MGQARLLCTPTTAATVERGPVLNGDFDPNLADLVKCYGASSPLDTGADAVVLGDLGCILNIEGRLRRRGDMKTKVMHIAEVLAGDSSESGARG